MIYPPNQKPPIWSIDPGIVAYNCQNAGIPHPVLAMPFWERGGDRALDYSGHGNHGTFGGNIPTWVSDGVSFPSVSEWIDIPNQDLTSNWTIVFEAYNNDTSIQPNGAMIVGNGDDDDNFIYIADNLRTRFENSAGTNVEWVADTDFYHKWRTCAFVADTTGVEYYLEANSQGRQVITPSLKFYYIGTGHATPTYDYDGIIKYMYLFNRPLTAAQIKLLYDDPYFMFRVPEELYGYVAAAAGVTIPVFLHHYNQMRQ